MDILVLVAGKCPRVGADGKNKTKTDGFLIQLAGWCARGTGWWCGWKNKLKKTDGFLILPDGSCARGTGWWCGWKKQTQTGGFLILLDGSCVRGTGWWCGWKKQTQTDGFLILLDGSCVRGTGWWCGWKKNKKKTNPNGRISHSVWRQVCERDRVVVWVEKTNNHKLTDFSFCLTAGVRGGPSGGVGGKNNNHHKLTDFSFYLTAGVRGGPSGGVGEEWAEWRSHHQPSLARHSPAGHALHGWHGPHHAVPHPAPRVLQVT